MRTILLKTWWASVRGKRVAFASGVILGAGITLAALELPYVNWQVAVAPVDTLPLVIRHDAKGDGRFDAPRSGGRRHRGIDLLATIDSPVRAIRSGQVVRVGLHHGFGQFVEIEHGEGLDSLYAHLNTVRVTPGVWVRQGDQIGTVGKTGNAHHPWILPHVHLEVTRNGEPIDPVALGIQPVDTRAVTVATAARPPMDDRLDSVGGE